MVFHFTQNKIRVLYAFLGPIFIWPLHLQPSSPALFFSGSLQFLPSHLGGSVVSWSLYVITSMDIGMALLTSFRTHSKSLSAPPSLSSLPNIAQRYLDHCHLPMPYTFFRFFSALIYERIVWLTHRLYVTDHFTFFISVGT